MEKISRHTTHIKFFVLLILWTLTFYPVYPVLIHDLLENPNNSHCLLVPFISLFFVWKKRDELKEAHVVSANWGLLILGLSMGVYILSIIGSVAVVARVTIVCSLIGLIVFNLGWSLFTIISFPILFLFFMVPVPVSIEEGVSFPLKLFATKISAFLIQGLSIPVYREGNMLYFAQSQLEVAEACSGIRSLVSLLTISIILAYVSRYKWIYKGVLIGSAVPLAFISNILRIVGTGVLAHFYGDRVARGFLHEFSGFALFFFGLILLFGVYCLLNKLDYSSKATED